MTVTTTSNVIIPEVLAAMIAAEIPGQLSLAGSGAVTVLDNLKGGPGNTIKIPRWGTIGDFTEVAEGDPMPVVNIAATAATATVKKFARGVEVTDEALLASYDDPLKEVARQFAIYAARAADRELVVAAGTTSLVHTAAATVTLNDIVDAIGKWDDAGNNIDSLVVHSKVYRDLIKLAEFKTLTSKSDQVIERGIVGQLYGVPVRVSDLLTTSAAVPTGTELTVANEQHTGVSDSGTVKLAHTPKADPTVKVGATLATATTLAKTGNWSISSDTITIAGSPAAGSLSNATIWVSYAYDQAAPGVPKLYHNLLVKKNALGLWYQRNMNVESERDTIKRTTVITADTIFAAAMFQSNPLPVVKLVTQ